MPYNYNIMSSLKDFTTQRKTEIKAITEKMLLLLKLTQKLPPDTLRVMELHYLQQKPLKEVCTILNKSMTVVRNHRNRGLFLLKKIYEAEKGES